MGGLSTLALLIIGVPVGIVICCFFCKSCPFYRRGDSKKSKSLSPSPSAMSGRLEEVLQTDEVSQPAGSGSPIEIDSEITTVRPTEI